VGVDGIVVIAVVVGVAVVGLVLWGLRGNEASRLRQRYLRSLHMPRAQAEEALARRLARLQERHPGKSEAWYLRHVLTELRRDRR
jgi:hypothetical protein